MPTVDQFEQSRWLEMVLAMIDSLFASNESGEMITDLSPRLFRSE
jgi:hypothetical protein